MNRYDRIYMVFLVGFMLVFTVGCVRTDDDADDAEGGLELSGGFFDEPEGEKETIIDDLAADYAGSPLLQDLAYGDRIPVDTDGYDTGYYYDTEETGGVTCDQISDCLCDGLMEDYGYSQQECEMAVSTMSDDDCAMLAQSVYTECL